MKWRPIALVIPLVLAVTAACGGVGATGERGQANRDQEPDPEAAPVGVFPLTGMPATDRGRLSRPAVSVKIDNNVQARPQAGIDSADVIYEEFTEGITRFVVVFQSSDAATVGPVRSVRPADPNIVKPFGGPLVFSGGSPAVLNIVRSAGVAQVTENDRATLRRRSGRRAPHNLYTSTEAMFRRAGSGSAPPSFSPFLREGQAFSPAGATPAATLNLAPAPNVRASYQWDAAAGVWKRSTDGRPHMLEGDVQLAPRNVIVQYTPYVGFAADRKVRYPEVVGSGDAMVFVGGLQVRARWTKSAPGSMTTYVDSAGTPIPLAPGQTWVHLQEPGSAVTTG
ncbi:MAG: DUF3048 domain-containing protein [Acidimicrobiales bacterium]